MNVMEGKVVCLVRHGVTASNKKGSYLGRSDEEGLEQANVLGKRLKD